MGMRLYVGNLSFAASDGDLRDLFAQVGEVQSAKVITDVYTGRSRGFGFVEMGTRDEGQRAIDQFNGKPLKGRPIIVNEARPPARRHGSDSSVPSPSPNG
jgi:RNA recognition motif-containing protein